MILIVDKNEQDVAPDTVSTLKKNFSQVIVTNLPHREHGGITVTAGDINIPLSDGNILAIERKTPSDFLNSIVSGHIFDQVEIMAEFAKFSAIIVTGRFLYKDKTDIVVIVDENGNEIDEREKWRGSSVRGAITSITYSGCPVIFCPPSKYCQTISELYVTVNKPAERQHIRKVRLITFPPVDDRVAALAQLPGVGILLADRLLKFAGMMDNNADADGYGTVSSAYSWITVMSQINKEDRPKGWTSAKILTLRKFFGLAPNEYIGNVKEIDLRQGKKVIPAIEVNGHIYMKKEK